LSEEEYHSYFGDLVDVDEYDSFIQHQEQLTKIQKLMPKDGNKPVEAIVQEDVPMSIQLNADGVDDIGLVVDIDGVLQDIHFLDNVNYKTHSRSHVDWRQVLHLRFESYIIKPKSQQQVFNSWSMLALYHEVPMNWL
jgi:hypothetical protein